MADQVQLQQVVTRHREFLAYPERRQGLAFLEEGHRVVEQLPDLLLVVVPLIEQVDRSKVLEQAPACFLSRLSQQV